MNVETIRWIDRAIGRPLCFLLTLHKKFFQFFKKNLFADKLPKKILFIKLIEQGSTVLAYPALKKAAQLVGKENLYFMVLRENRPIVDILDVVDPCHILEIGQKNILTLIRSVLNVMITVRKEKIDSVIDMEFLSRSSAILSYLTGAGQRVGLHLFSCEGPYRGDAASRAGAADHGPEPVRIAEGVQAGRRYRHRRVGPGDPLLDLGHRPKDDLLLGRRGIL